MIRPFRLPSARGCIAAGVTLLSILSAMAQAGEGAPAAAAAAAAPEVTFTPPLPAPRRESASYWRRAGKAQLDAIMGARDPGTKARNVILFVGDGMSVATVTAARILQGQKDGSAGEENLLAFETFPYTALSKTYNTDAQTPDSAGTMTAMVTGIKTRVGVISVDQSVAHGDCAGTPAASVTTLLEEAESAGLATGVVSTARITHATPAATYAHAPDRGWEMDGALPEGAEACADIARQLVEFDHGDGIEVVLGGGRHVFWPTVAAESTPTRVGGRTDGRDLIAEWQTRYPRGRWVTTATELDALNPRRVDQVFGLFTNSHMSFEADRPDAEPSLAAMTEFALKRLRHKTKGFFLMVEAGRIDHGHHAGNAHRALHDTLALSDAVAVARKLTKEKETLIIVTADHSHTMTIAGYQARGNRILDLVRDRAGRPLRDARAMPYTTLSYANGPGHTGASARQPAGSKKFPHIHDIRSQGIQNGRPNLARTDTTAPAYLQEATVPMSSETHGGEDVPIYAIGPGSQWVRGVLEQNLIYWIMREALDQQLAR